MIREFLAGLIGLISLIVSIAGIILLSEQAMGYSSPERAFHDTLLH